MDDVKVTAQVTYTGTAWLGFGIARGPAMVGAHAFIAKPDVGTASQYLLGSKSQSGITPVSATSLTGLWRSE
jgi:hypothetical protein